MKYTILLSGIFVEPLQKCSSSEHEEHFKHDVFMIALGTCLIRIVYRLRQMVMF